MRHHPSSVVRLYVALINVMYSLVPTEGLSAKLTFVLINQSQPRKCFYFLFQNEKYFFLYTFCFHGLNTTYICLAGNCFVDIGACYN